MFTRKYLSMLIPLAFALQAQAGSVPEPDAFVAGVPVILDFTEDDMGKKSTGLRLTSMGLFTDESQNQYSVWRLRNSADASQFVTLSAYGSGWEATYEVAADSEYFVASPQQRHTHQLWLNNLVLDTKAAGGHSYSLPEVEDGTGGDSGSGGTVGNELPDNDNGGSGESLSDEEVFARGMAAWRKPDEIFEGAACANCHAPDGFDLAYFDFTRDTIIRRAAPHLPDESDQIAIADMIEYLREKYQIVNPKDPLTFRPFQPGGEALPGNNRFERDTAFGQVLKDSGFRFANVPVLSLDEARQQRDEWQQLDVREIPIGIDLPRWSEDGFHGEQHISLNDWLPSLPRLPKEANTEQWYALQDAYIADPSDENFFKYYEAIDKEYIRITSKEANPQLTEQPFSGSGNWLMGSKYKAVQFASHLFRHEHIVNGEDRIARQINGFDKIADNKIRKPRSLTNPMWSVGDFFRVNDGQGELKLPTTAPFPSGLADTHLEYNQEAEKNKVEWFMLGWLFDPALTKTCCGNPAKTAEYFQDALSRSGEIGALRHEQGRRASPSSYPIHNVYIFTKKVIDKNYTAYAINQQQKRGCDTANGGCTELD